MGVLARADAGALNRRVAELDALPDVDTLRPAEFGAVMTRGRAGGAGRMFSLGEMTVTRCAVRLRDAPDIVGHAYVQGRNARKAELAAIVDAMMQTAEHRVRAETTIVTPLAEEEAERRMRARRKSGATKVDFFTMVRAES